MNLLELRFYPIEGKLNCFKVSVEGSLGEVHHEPSLPFLEGEIPDVRDRRFTIVKVLESTKFYESNFDELEQAWLVGEQLLLEDKTAFKPQYLAIIGRRLYQVLGQNIQQVIEAAVADAKRDRTWLHIRLRFPADVPKYIRLTDYPWELLHNDYRFLAHQGVTFSRYIAYRSPRPNLPSVERLNVLLISSGASDERMKLESLPPVEREAIIQGLQKAQEQGKIQLELLSPPTLNRLRQRLLERQASPIPHVLHFDGHGFFGKRCNECRKTYKQSATNCECGAPLGEPQGYLVFERADGTADYVSATELGELLGNLERLEQPNLEPGIALIVLSACRSGMSRLSESVFNGVAQNLIGQGIPAVVAMQYSISVLAASTFSEYFYRSLGEEEALAIALRRGQSAMGIENNQWYRPVLYLRWEDNEGGKLFKPQLRSIPTPSYALRQKRKQLLNAVELDISQHLKDALPKEEKMDLFLEDRREEVGRPVTPGAKFPDQPSENLMDIFNQKDIQRKLLILGAAGSGKTIVIYKLAEDLLKRAEADKTQPIPVIFDLSTWKDGKQSIKEWLIAQLKKKYNVPIDISQYWLKKQQLLLLLDGLDMLGLSRQLDCVKAINSFVQHEETNQLPLMVCCRLEEYKEGYERSNGVQLELNGAICLKSLTDLQIQEYLERFDLRDSFYNNIQQKPELEELARIPLFLTMMSRISPERTFITIKNNKSTEELKKEILGTYIKFKLDQVKKLKDRRKTRNYLTWLASKIPKAGSYPKFYIDQMQLDWLELESPEQTWSYSIGIGITIGLIYGIIIGLLYILKRGTSEGVTVGLITWLVGSLICILPLVLLFEFRLIRSRWNKRKQVIYSFGIGSAFSLLSFLVWQLFISPQNALILALVLGLLSGLNDAFRKGEQGQAFDEIIPVRSLSGIPKKEKIKKVLSLWIIWHTIFGLLFGIFNVLNRSLIFWLISNWICAIIFGIGNLIVISESKIEMQMIPNQGIWDSAKSAALFTLVGVLGLGLLAGISGIPILWGIVVGLYTGLYRGGSVCIQHLILRLILCVNGKIPWNYAKFLDYAEKLQLIIKVGGSYRFLHPLLREHFAKMG